MGINLFARHAKLSKNSVNIKLKSMWDYFVFPYFSQKWSTCVPVFPTSVLYTIGGSTFWIFRGAPDGGVTVVMAGTVGLGCWLLLVVIANTCHRQGETLRVHSAIVIWVITRLRFFIYNSIYWVVVIELMHTLFSSAVSHMCDIRFKFKVSLSWKVVIIFQKWIYSICLSRLTCSTDASPPYQNPSPPFEFIS